MRRPKAATRGFFHFKPFCTKERSREPVGAGFSSVRLRPSVVFFCPCAVPAATSEGVNLFADCHDKSALSFPAGDYRCSCNQINREVIMPRNVAGIVLFTAVALTGALPQTALASCSGNTCTFGRFGKVTVQPAKASAVLPQLAKLDSTYDSASSSYSQAVDLLSQLKALTSKFGTKEQIAAEALARRAKSDQLTVASNVAAIAANALRSVARSVVSAEGHLATAKTNLQLARRELQNVQDANRVKELREAAEQAQSLDGVFGAASSAFDLAKKVGEGEVSTELAKSVVESATKLIGAFNAANLESKAAALDAAVKKSTEAVGKDKVTNAAQALMQAQADLKALKSDLQSNNISYENSMKTRDKTYGEGGPAKYGLPADLVKANEVAGKLARTLKQAYGDAYTVKQTVEKLESSGDWIAPPQSEGIQALHAFKDHATSMFNDCVKLRPEVEKAQKLVQDAYAAAGVALSSPL